MKNKLINIGLLLGTLIVFFGGGELALRMVGIGSLNSPPPPIYQVAQTREISYELKPNMKEFAFRSTITTNENGFRISGHNKSKEIIAVIGDSITFGYGVNDEETVPANLQKLTSDYRVINAGVAGYNLSQEMAVWTEKIAPLNPEVLVLITHFNDIENKGAETAVLDEDGYLRGPNYDPNDVTCSPIDRGLLKLIPGKCFLDLHSNFYRTVKEFVTTRSGDDELKEREKEEQEDPQESVTEEDLLLFDMRLSEFSSQIPNTTKKLLVLWPEWRLHSAVRPTLKKIAESHGFTMLDLYDTFGNTAETLGWDTVHPSANTTREAAKLIWGQIQSL